MDNCDVIIKDSGKPGPSIVIIGGVHGNEHCGEKAIREVAPEFTPAKGKATFIIANKEALEKDVRYIENDLNRSFDVITARTLEERTANSIKPYLDSADAMLDLHASNAEKSEPFIICEEHSLRAASVLPAKRVLTGIDNYHSGSTDEYMNKLGKIGICIECGYNDDPKTTIVAKQAITSFCAYYGLVDGAADEATQESFKVTGKYEAKNDSFVANRKYEDFERVKKGEIVGMDGEEAVVMEENNHVIFMSKEAMRGEQCFMTVERT